MLAQIWAEGKKSGGGGGGDGLPVSSCRNFYNDRAVYWAFFLGTNMGGRGKNLGVGGEAVMVSLFPLAVIFIMIEQSTGIFFVVS